MARRLSIHPDNPQARAVSQAVAALRQGQVLVYPTDSSYALGCRVEDKAAQDRIRRARRLDDSHNFTLVCRDLSELAIYAKVDNAAYRLMRSLTPGPYTFILKAGREVPRRLQNPKRRTIGLRVPDNAIALALLEALGEPIMSSTLHIPGDDYPISDVDEIDGRLDAFVDLVIDGGSCGLEPTSIIDLDGPEPVVVRRGRGSTEMFDA